MITVAWINYLLFQLCKIVSVKVLGGALTRKLNLISGYTIIPLDIKRWPSLGLGADPATPRLSSEREFRMQGGLLCTSWLNGRAFLLPLIRCPYPFKHYTRCLGTAPHMLGQKFLGITDISSLDTELHTLRSFQDRCLHLTLRTVVSAAVLSSWSLSLWSCF